jgi:hypothetical protein
MSSEIPPDPVTDEFNPAAWTLPALTPEEEALLNAQFVTYPITQSNTITFPVAPISQTLPNGTNTTQVATTGFVQNAITAFTSTVNTWLGTQIFSVGMTSNTINPTTTSGTLIIGNAAVNTNVEVATQSGRTAVLRLGDGTGSTTSGGIHIGNGLASTNAVNILYSSTDAGSSGIINLGAVNATTNLRCPLTSQLTYNSTTGLGSGKIGEVLTVTVASVAIPTTANTPINVASQSVPAGVWILTGTCSQDLNNTTGSANYIKLAISPTTDSYTNAQGGQFNRVFNTTRVGVATVSSTTIVSNSTATTWYLVAQSALSAGNFTLISFTITRVA